MAKAPQNIYRTAKGAQIDMLKMITQNEMTMAVGNAKVNARGDKLGPGGQVISKREDTRTAIPNQVAGKKDVNNMDPEGNE